MAEYMETTMRAPVLAKKLRDRLKVLKSERVKLLAKREKDFETWKVEVAKWLKTEPQKAIPRVTKNCIEGRYGRYANTLPDFVFAGMPKPPTKPDDKVIRDIQKTLRYMAFTGTPKVSVSKDQLDDWFGKVEGEEQDDDQ